MLPFSAQPPGLCSPWSVPAVMFNVFYAWTTVKVTTFALSIYLWLKDGWLLIVIGFHIECGAYPCISFCLHLYRPSVDHFSLTVEFSFVLLQAFCSAFSSSALLFLSICIGKTDCGVINQKWSGVEEQCCGSLGKPPCPLFPLGRPYSITLPFVLAPSFHFSVCCLS